MTTQTLPPSPSGESPYQGGPEDHIHAAGPAPARHKAPTPAEKEQLAQEIAHEGPEGSGDPTAGPALLRGEVLLLLVGLAVVAALLAIFVRPVVGLAFAGIALIAMVFNPTVVTTLLRAQDREIVREKYHHQPPGRSG